MLHQDAQLAGNGECNGRRWPSRICGPGTSPPKFAICASAPGGHLNLLLLFVDPSLGETAGRAVPHNGNWITLVA